MIKKSTSSVALDLPRSIETYPEMITYSADFSSILTNFRTSL
jgi:hypothetical protein